MPRFDDDTCVEEIAPGQFRAAVAPGWNVGAVPNGGYVLALGLAAMRRGIEPPDPVTATAHYLRPTTVGPAEIAVTHVKAGRHATVVGSLSQEGKERVRFLATFGDLSGEGPEYVQGAPPEPDFCAADAASLVPPFPVEIRERFDVELDSVENPFSGAPGARLKARIRFEDGREPDVHSLALFSDALPPPVFRVASPGWVPTLELTVHFRARPEPGWLRVMFQTRFLFGGYLEEDGEIWDSSGRLVALSRQLAGAPRQF